MSLKQTAQEMGDWLSQPFRRDMPISQLLLIFILFIIVAFIVFDMLRILQSWSAVAVEAVAEAVT